MDQLTFEPPHVTSEDAQDHVRLLYFIIICRFQRVIFVLKPRPHWSCDVQCVKLLPDLMY